MKKQVVIALIVVIALGLVGAALYFTGKISPKSQGSQNTIDRSTTGNSDNINVDVASNYRELTIKILDKNLIGTYLNQYDFWNKEIPYYNPNLQVIGKFRMVSLTFVLSKGNPEDFPFAVGNLGKFGQNFDVREQGDGLTIPVYIDPTLVSSLPEEDLAKRFSAIAISSINFLTQSQIPNPDAIQVVEPPAPFVQIVRSLVENPPASPTTIEEFNQIPEVE